MGMDVILLTGVGVLILIGLFTHHLKLQGVTERIVRHIIPKDFRKYLSPQHRMVFLDDTYCRKKK